MTGRVLNRSLLLTPPGAGALGVIRVIGPEVSSIVGELFRTKSGEPPPRDGDDRLRYGWFVDGAERIDDVIVSYASSPVVTAIDICVHGGVRVIERVLAVLEEHGAPLPPADSEVAACWPAANIIEREAVEALAGAKTERAVRFLGWQREHLPAALMRVSSVFDANPSQAKAELKAMTIGYAAARILLGGATVVLVGPANSGKSTLFNRLVGRSAALVSTRAGTTRDWVAQPVEMAGVPVTLIDTAGLHPDADAVGHHAVGAGRGQSRQADLCLVVLDSSAPLTDEVNEALLVCNSVSSCLIVQNKVDAGLAWDGAALHHELEDTDPALIRTSAKTGEGLDTLVGGILEAVGFGCSFEKTPCLFTRRQAAMAGEALSDLAGRPSSAEEVIKWRLLSG